MSRNIELQKLLDMHQHNDLEVVPASLLLFQQSLWRNSLFMISSCLFKMCNSSKIRLMDSFQVFDDSKINFQGSLLTGPTPILWFNVYTCAACLYQTERSLGQDLIIFVLSSMHIHQVIDNSCSCKGMVQNCFSSIFHSFPRCLLDVLNIMSGNYDR